MTQAARRANDRLVWTVEMLAAFGLFLVVVLVLEMTLPAAREAAESVGLVLSVGHDCLR